jgi:hypothetical protein
MLIGGACAAHGGPVAVGAKADGLTSRIPQRVRDLCADAREHVTPRLTVRCPTLVLVGGLAVDPKLSNVVLPPRKRPFYELTVNNGIQGTHWIVGAGTARWVGRYVFDPRENEDGRAAKRVGTTTVLGRRATIYAFDDRGGGIHSGHTLVAQTVGKTTTFASVHGHGAAHAAVAARMLCGMLATPADCPPEG